MARYPEKMHDTRTDEMKWRVTAVGETSEEIESATFVNASLEIVDQGHGQSDEDLIERIQLEAQGHHRSNPRQIRSKIEELVKKVKGSEDRSYLKVIEKTTRLMNAAGLLKERLGLVKSR